MEDMSLLSVCSVKEHSAMGYCDPAGLAPSRYRFHTERCNRNSPYYRGSKMHVGSTLEIYY